MSNRHACILTIGDELLIGQISDTNSTWISQQLNEIGWSIKSRETVGDNVIDISEALDRLSQKSNVVIVTGGLGPTSDDRTLDAMAAYFKVPLVLYPEVENKIKNYFFSRGRRVSGHHSKQYYLPEEVKVLDNNVGTAPGMLMKRDDTQFFFVPGVPVELRYIFNNHIRTRLERMNPGSTVEARLFTAGIGETRLLDKLADALEDWPPQLQIAYLPYLGGVRLRLTASGRIAQENQKLITKAVNTLRKRLQGHFIADDYNQWNEIIQSIMTKRGFTLSTAESCTGGYIASRLTDLPGSSAYFSGSVVSYANYIKRDVLGVRKDTLKMHGAVSRECAEEMLDGLIQLTCTDIGIAVTGIAGPDGGSKNKPVGTVFICVGDKGRKITNRFNFRSSRKGIVEYSYHQAMYMVYKFLSTL